jgi:hypothetical protein
MCSKLNILPFEVHVEHAPSARFPHCSSCLRRDGSNRRAAIAANVVSFPSCAARHRDGIRDGIETSDSDAESDDGDSDPRANAEDDDDDADDYTDDDAGGQDDESYWNRRRRQRATSRTATKTTWRSWSTITFVTRNSKSDRRGRHRAPGSECLCAMDTRWSRGTPSR